MVLSRTLQIGNRGSRSKSRWKLAQVGIDLRAFSCAACAVTKVSEQNKKLSITKHILTSLILRRSNRAYAAPQSCQAGGKPEMLNIQTEISRTVPQGTEKRIYKQGNPILYTFGCVLLERETYGGFVYTAVNLKTNKCELMARKKYPLSPSGIEIIAEKIRQSSIAGAGRLEIDRPFEDRIDIDKARDILNEVFRKVLPLYGYTIREEQISLAEHILNAIRSRYVSLDEAGVGAGKTLAYLIAAIIIKRGRINDFWNMGLYPNMPYYEMANMPIVIATSSIALQRAILTEYIPVLSDILLECRIIRKPLTAVMRKGKENYICEHNLHSYLYNVNNKKTKQILNNLRSSLSIIDLNETDGLTPYVKRKIAVPQRCFDDCQYREKCPYLEFRNKSQSSVIDIQVCNHNYLIADTLRRKDKQYPLIPNYQTLIIDEAHKFLFAARTMYGIELSNLSLPKMLKTVESLTFKKDKSKKTARDIAKCLADKSNLFFRDLKITIPENDSDEEAERFTVHIDKTAKSNLVSMYHLINNLLNMIKDEKFIGYGSERKSQIIWDLEQLSYKTNTLVKHGELICWLEINNKEKLLGAIPKNLDKLIYDDFWNKSIPTILTSGTLSVNSDFSRIKRTLGLDFVKNRLTEISKPSPFDYRKNALIYISENTLFPHQQNNEYILSIANEIEKLIHASHGHAAVLFTSYKAMDMVLEHLDKRKIPFPIFRLKKGGIREIERFKQSGNGILFAAGTMWEGIDIPGDALSMLIIVKLPFAVPDPIGEYEQTLYEDFYEYKELVIEPEMLIKTKQGFGRAIRTETDTAVIAIIDIRASKYRTYRGIVIDILPDCEITDNIYDVEKFYETKKSPEYYK